MRFAALIIAAGYSSRMGAFKPLLPINKQSALQHVVQLFRHAGVNDILVITGHNSALLEKEARILDVKTAFNPDYSVGMFSSICFGLRQFENIDGFLLLPVDIPLVRLQTIRRLQKEFTGKDVLLPVFKGIAGHPPVIPAHLKDAILGYKGSGGLRKFLTSCSHNTIPVWDSAVLQDMDTQEDYEQLIDYKNVQSCGTRDEVIELARMNMEEPLLSHCLAVARVGEKLGKALQFSPDRLNRLYNGAILHDIGKGHPDHAVYGASMVRGFGLDGLAPCVENHMELGCSSGLDEISIVYLADKLVCGTELVSIEKRFQYKLEKYRDDGEACDAIGRRLAVTLEIQELVEQKCGMKILEIVQ